MLRSRTLRLFLLLFAVVVVTGLALTFIPSDHYLVLPDRARPTDPLVSVPGEERGSADDGGIYMVDVRVGRANLFERLFPGVREGADLVPERVINPEGVSDTQRRRSSLNEMSRSQLIAITVALRQLGREVDIEAVGAEVVLVQPNAPADGELEVGDVIVAAQGEDVTSTSDLQRAMSDLAPGDEASLTVERGEDEQIDLTLPTRASDQDPERAVVGVQVQDAEDFHFPVDIEIDAGSIGGPSAGLAFALDIVDELGEDVDGGRTVVATGELTLEGDVLPIGGIKQKVIGARQAGADVFLVPDRNAADARAAAEGLEIIAVSDLDEALSALAAA
ncbi:MAG: S16 family serine protease [Gaiellaceae bacterium]